MTSTETIRAFILFAFAAFIGVIAGLIVSSIIDPAHWWVYAIAGSWLMPVVAWYCVLHDVLAPHSPTR